MKTKRSIFCNQTTNRAIFFERSPFMSVELLGLLNNYTIICYDDDSVYRLLKNNWNLSSYMNTKFTRALDNDKAIEIVLQDKNFIYKTIQNKETSKALLFYMNSRIDDLLKEINMPMLLPSYEVQEKLGSKLYLSTICKKLNISQNNGVNFLSVPKRKSTLFIRCRKMLGLPFIVQGSLGVSGEDTFLINSEKELEGALNKIKNSFRATRYIHNNIPVSVHVCILDDQVLIQGPFIQIVGFSELSANPFQFCGNDTNQSIFDQKFVNEVRDMSLRISEYAKAESYRGILGIDYLWDRDSGVIYPQEINARLVGLTRLLTGIQNDQSILPDLIKHVEYFSKPCRSRKCKDLASKDINLLPHDYSQIIIHNNLTSKIMVSKRIEPGIYQIKNNILQMVRRSLFMHDMKTNDILITQTAHEGRELSSGGIIAKILLKRNAISYHKYKLESKVTEIIELIRKQIIKPNDKS